MFRLHVLLAVVGIVWAGSVRADDPDVNADEALLRGARIATDGPGLLEYFRQRVPTEATREKIEALIDKLASGKFREREKATAELFRIGVPARPFLVKMQHHKDIEVRRRIEECLAVLDKLSTAEVEGAAIRVLRARRPAGASAVLLEVLPALRDEGLQEEVQAALLDVGVKDGKADEALVKGLLDKVAARRMVAALVVGRSGNKEQREQVRKLLQSDSEMRVRLRAAQGLVAGKDVQAVAALLPLLTDAPMELAEQARDLLSAVALDKGPPRSLTDGRAKCREEWEAWYKANQGKIDLTRAEVELAWINANTRAMKLTVQFLDVFIKGDIARLKKMTDVPFFQTGSTVENAQTLEAFLSLHRNGSGKAYTFAKPRLVDVKRFAARPERAAVRGFLTKVPASQLRIVYTTALDANSKMGGEPIVVFVRVRGSQLRIVGADMAHDEK